MWRVFKLTAKPSYLLEGVRVDRNALNQVEGVKLTVKPFNQVEGVQVARRAF
jgi:hypothetical protein